MTRACRRARGGAGALVLAMGLALGRAAGGHAGDVAPDTRAASVSVEFVQPEQFTDIADGAFATARGRALVLDELGRYMRETAARLVPTALALELRVTDVDLAGAFEPWRGPQFERVRVYRDVYPPRIDLEFRLTNTEGGVVREGRRSLRDQNYLLRAGELRDGDPLRHEKAMLRDWLREEFAAPASLVR